MARTPTTRAPRGAPSDDVGAAHVAVECTIIHVREQRVILDSDLAALYGVEVKALNQAVKRNRDRFPGDFMFQLTKMEAAVLRSQIVTANAGRGGRRTAPFAFTEQGVAMLSSVLHSDRAIRVNIEIMRAFVRLRAILLTNAGLARKLAALERNVDGRFKLVLEAIHDLRQSSTVARRRIGFDR